jgi:hypothetical protein
MKIASLVLGILSAVGMIIGFFPCLGALNWIVIPFAGIGLIISVIAVTQTKEGESKGNAIAGLILCSVALLFGLIRLFMGGGIV